MIDKIKKIAASYAEEYCCDAIYPSHLFKAVLHKEANLVKFIETTLDKDYYYLQEWADVQMQLTPRAAKPAWQMEYSQESLDVMDEAESYKEKFGLPEVDGACVLASLVTPGVGFSFDQLKTLPLTAAEICSKFGASTDSAVVPQNIYTGASGEGATGNVLEQYGINKNKQYATGELPQIVGFEYEIASIFEILGRYKKSNLLITGESGVGKTSLINAIVQQVVEGNTPSFLQGAVIYELDLAAIAADASYKGEISDRFKKIFAEIKQKENIVLVIEQIDKLFDKQSMLFDGSTILKSEMDKGNLLLLCTSSIDGFTKNIETDKEFVRKVERITVEEPNTDMCLRILKGAVDTYEKYHDLTISVEVMTEAIRLAKRYLTERALPDSAFDLIDRTMALIKTTNDMSEAEVSALFTDYDRIKEMEKTGTPEDVQYELEWLHYRMMHKISPIILAQLKNDVDFIKLPSLEDKFKYVFTTLEQIAEIAKEKKTSIDGNDIYAVVAKQTGIPLGKVQSKERDRLINAEDTLRKRVIGQDHAVKVVLDSVFEARSGLNKKGQPMGSFFFLGPTGTGKTELSKALAEFLFEDESALIRFDMSEFKEEHSVALLYGAPPGYVGYEEGGLLVNKIRQKPYAVVLFDEIEKAHKSVFDLFLQILDEGKLHDRLGRVGDFSNALILFTSNIGSKFIVDSFNKGAIPQNNDLMNIMQDHFRPEFLGRLTEIVPFSPIMEETVVRIFEIHLKGLLKLLAEQNIELRMSEETKKTIALRGYNQQYGARPIIGIIRKELRRPLSKLIIAGKIKSGDTVQVEINDGEVEFKTI